MNPFLDKDTFSICKKFYQKYYGDDGQRQMIIGINPGRFGGGITGIPFTDPIHLEAACGIASSFARRHELSSIFIYQMIEAFGGPEKFYQQFYITSVSPLGFKRQNKNLNYYDDKDLEKSIKPFVIDCFEKQMTFGINRTTAFCMGEGKNYKYLSRLNNEVKLFQRIIPLSHPRFIMQYRPKRKDEYIQQYLRVLSYEF